MSLSRTTATSQWLLSQTHRRSGLCRHPIPSADCIGRYPATPVACPTSTQRFKSSYYSTRARPRRSPAAAAAAARRAAEIPRALDNPSRAGGRELYTPDGLLRSRLYGWDAVETQKMLSPLLREFHAAALKDGILPAGVGFGTFKSIATGIIELAGVEDPCPGTLARISNDFDLIYLVGHAMTVAHAQARLRTWVLSATAQAGAYIPTIILAARYLNHAHTRIPPRMTLLDRVEEWAIQHRDPRSMLLHAQVLARHDQYVAALRLVAEVIQCMRAVNTRPRDSASLILNDLFEPPWETYRCLKERATAVGTPDQREGRDASVDAVARRGALDFQDPRALVSYARAMMREGNLEAYEEGMSQAASAGDMNACRKLANFYYLTSLGRFPRRGEEGTGWYPITVGADDAVRTEGADRQRQDVRRSNAVGSFFSHLFGFRRCRSHEGYRLLARDWHELAYSYGCRKSALIFAILSRRQEEYESGLEALAIAESESTLAIFARRLRPKWHDQSYDPKIPEQLLDT